MLDLDDTLILLLSLCALLLFMVVGAIAADFLGDWLYDRRVRKQANVHWLKRNTK